MAPLMVSAKTGKSVASEQAKAVMSKKIFVFMGHMDCYEFGRERQVH